MTALVRWPGASQESRVDRYSQLNTEE